MKKQMVFIGIILTLLLVLAGCGASPANETPEKVETPELESEVVVEEAEVVEQEADENEDTEFVNPFSDNNTSEKDYYYELEVISDGNTDLLKFWVSGNKSRMEMIPSETQDHVVTILDKDEKVSYIYEPEENTVMIMDYDPTESLTSDDKDYIDSIIAIFDDDGAVKVENGNLDGEEVQIISGNMFGEKNIIWVSTKNKFPLKSETYSDDQVSLVRLFKNFRYETPDPSLFVLPEGVEVVD